ncbi:MAG: PLP-dependent aminotransferase family protein [Thalassolituus sp.]|uniref:aminotransferase-like domain-containing protein n=1 Tax=Thalassolituus sp. TaxID=2030822 RepID=UPI0039824569
MHTAKHVQQLRSSYIREILKAATADGVISLAGGLPAADLFPHMLLQEAMLKVANNRQVFQYGETRGYAPLLEHLSKTFNLQESHGTLVTTGSQQGLDLIARTYLNSEDHIAMEAPSYLGALQVFTLAQATINTVPQTPSGPDIKALKQLFESRQVKLFYAVPDFHNPTGISWSLQTRQEVARLCQTFNVTLIEDAPYRDLRFFGDDLPLVSSFCPDHSLVLRSSSKTSAPGLRLGSVTGPEEWITHLIRVKQTSDLHSSLPMQAALLEILTHPGFEQHLCNVRSHYHQRYQALSEAINTHLQSEVSFTKVEGGMFLWLKLAKGDPMQIAKMALKKGVAIVPGSVFYIEEDIQSPAIRLNFSYCKPEQLATAIQLLASVIALPK